MPCLTRVRCCWFLLVLLLAAQTFWHRQSYQNLAYRLTVHTLYQGEDTEQDDLRRSAGASHIYWQVMTKSTSVVRLPDGQAAGPRDVLHDESKFLRSLRKSFNRRSNTSSMETHPKDGGYGSLARTACQQLKDLERSALYEAIINNFTLQKHDARDSFVNLHSYGYMVDSSLCKKRPYVVILVHSKYDHFDRRELIRHTWASNGTLKDMVFKTVFFLGQPNVEELRVKENKKVAKKREQLLVRDKMAATMKRIRLEAKLFGDIVMGNFTDSYRNLTIKHIMILDWVMSHCPHTRYVVKVDDDVFVNMFNVATYARQTSSNNKTSGLLSCRIVQAGTVQRGNRNKWFVSEREYPFQLYPFWCMGYGVFMTRDVSKKLLEMSREVRSFWIDDVYVTGLLRYRAGQPLTSLPVNLAKLTDDHGSSAQFDAMFVLMNMNSHGVYMRYWQELLAAHQRQVQTK